MESGGGAYPSCLPPPFFCHLLRFSLYLLSYLLGVTSIEREVLLTLACRRRYGGNLLGRGTPYKREEKYLTGKLPPLKQIAYENGRQQSSSLVVGGLQ